MTTPKIPRPHVSDLRKLREHLEAARAVVNTAWWYGRIVDLLEGAQASIDEGRWPSALSDAKKAEGHEVLYARDTQKTAEKYHALIKKLHAKYEKLAAVEEETQRLLRRQIEQRKKQEEPRPDFETQEVFEARHQPQEIQHETATPVLCPDVQSGHPALPADVPLALEASLCPDQGRGLPGVGGKEEEPHGRSDHPRPPRSLPKGPRRSEPVEILPAAEIIILPRTHTPEHPLRVDLDKNALRRAFWDALAQGDIPGIRETSKACAEEGLDDVRRELLWQLHRQEHPKLRMLRRIALEAWEDVAEGQVAE
jgi:hypothetical protein